MQLEGRSAVVAGGAGGLGRATVRRLAALGVGVVVLDPAADQAADVITEHEGRVAITVGDSNDDEAVSAAISAAALWAPFRSRSAQPASSSEAHGLSTRPVIRCRRMSC